MRASALAKLADAASKGALVRGYLLVPNRAERGPQEELARGPHASGRALAEAAEFMRTRSAR